MNQKIINWILFLLLCFIWGSSFLLMKMSAEALTIPQIAALRIFSAGVVFTPLAAVHFARIPRKKIMAVLAAGFFGNLFPAFFFAAAVTTIDSSLAGILNALTPISVVIIAFVFFKERPGSRKIAGVLTGFAGVLLLTLTQQAISLHHLGYAALVLLGTLSYGININLVGHYLKTVNPVHVSSVSLSFMAIPAFIVLWTNDFFRLDLAGRALHWPVLASVLLGIGGSAIATLLFYILVQKAGGLFASLVTYGIPFIALFWGSWYGEKITAPEIVCLGIILCGVWLANQPGSKHRQQKKKTVAGGPAKQP